MAEAIHGPGSDDPGRVILKKDPYSILMVHLLSVLVVLPVLGIFNRNLG